MGVFVNSCSGNSTPFFFFLFSICVSVLVHSSLARNINLKWEVEYMHWSPDCIESVVMGINGQFPGPTIRARAGDTLIIELTNKLHTEGVVIHWHGITQIGTPWADGTAAISQCAINAGETFVYNFTVEKDNEPSFVVAIKTVEYVLVIIH